LSNSKSLIRTQNFLKKQKFENSVVTKVAWIIKHYFDGILRRIYKPSKKFSSRAHIRIFQNAPRTLTPGTTEKKVPPRHQSRYIGSTLDVVYRRLKVVEAPITFAIKS
jgi:hypothetical protein